MSEPVDLLAVEQAYLELAALFPRPSDPQLADMTVVTQKNNPADAVCLLQAYFWLRIALGKETHTTPPKFANTYCSQCGLDLGPGNHGLSHCEDHQKEIDRLLTAAEVIRLDNVQLRTQHANAQETIERLVDDKQEQHAFEALCVSAVLLAGPIKAGTLLPTRIHELVNELSDLRATQKLANT